MIYLKMLISGIAVPTLLLPLIFLLAKAYGRQVLFTFLFPHLIPLIWGIWNVIYLTLFEKVLPGQNKFKYFIAGALLGLLIAIFAVYVLNIPQYLNLPSSLYYLPLVLGPVAYGILWMYLVQPLNSMLKIKS